MPPKTTRKKSKSKNKEGLIAALEFISVAQKSESDTFYKTHCVLNNGLAMAYDGIITAGCKIEETLSICPHTYKLIAALERTSKEVSITELEGRLSVKSGDFSAFVPCFHEAMPNLTPDDLICGLDDTLKIAFDTISGFTVENSKKVVESSILLQANSCLASDGFCMLEFWHGFNLPTCVLPKSFISAIINCKKSLKGFGYSGASCTFWFEDDSWIKTQLYEEEWPDVNSLMNKPCNPLPLPEGFYEALSNIEPFSKGKETEKVVFFNENCLQSHRDKNEGAVYKLNGIIHGPAFNIKRLKRISHCIKTVDFYTHNAMMFFGEGVRGILMGVRA